MRLNRKVVCVDLVSITGSCFVGFWASRESGSEHSSLVGKLEASVVAPSIFLIWLIVLVSLGAWDRHLLLSGNEFYARGVRATFFAFGVASAIAYFFHVDVVRHFSMFTLPIGLVTIFSGRWYLRARSGMDPPLYQALLIGRNHVETSKSLASEKSVNVEVVATTEELNVESIVRRQVESRANLAVIGANHGLSNSELRELLWTFEQFGVEVWFDASTAFIAQNRSVLLSLRNTTIVVSDIRHLTIFQRVVKRFFDVCLSMIALVLLAPILLVASIAIRVLDNGRVLFRQQRVGVDGRYFSLLKLRTMVDGERPPAPVGMSKDKDDSRITPVGRVLRRWSIDEIPQFVNVLRGEMSVVGPRPRLPEEVQSSNIMSRRLRAKPGITGLWQVSGRSLLTLDEAEALDIDYVDSWSLVGDVVIILRTVRVVLSGRGAF